MARRSRPRARRYAVDAVVRFAELPSGVATGYCDVALIAISKRARERCVMEWHARRREVAFTRHLPRSTSVARLSHSIRLRLFLSDTGGPGVQRLQAQVYVAQDLRSRTCRCNRSWKG